MKNLNPINAILKSEAKTFETPPCLQHETSQQETIDAKSSEISPTIDTTRKYINSIDDIFNHLLRWGVDSPSNPRN